MGRERRALAGRHRREIEREVVVVDAGAVAQRRVARLLEQVDADDRAGAEIVELLADEAVAGAEVQHLERRGIDALLGQLLTQQVADDARRVARQAVGEELLVEARHVEDLGVVVQADASPLAFDGDLTPLLVLVETAGGVGRREMKREVE